MNELKPEDVMRALEHCANYKSAEVSCIGCPIYGRCFDEPNLIEISALALLREKDAEIERLTRICDSYVLQYGTAVDKEVLLKQERADIVRKMQERLKERAMPVTGGKGFEGANRMATNLLIDQIAKEMLEGKMDET